MSGIYTVQDSSHPDIREPVILANSTEVDNNDFVEFSSGFIAKIAAGVKIEGVYTGNTQTATSDNQTVAKVKAVYQAINDDMTFRITATAALVQANIGQYADISISTNAILLNQASLSASAGQLQILNFDPDGDGTTTLAVVKVAEPAMLDFAQP